MLNLINLRDVLALRVPNVYFNIRSINEVPLEHAEFASIYVDTTNIEYPRKTQTTYIVVYAKRAANPTDISEFASFQRSAMSLVVNLQQLFPNANTNIEWGNNDAYFFAQIKLAIKEVAHV
jgi:hypothetical protein